MRIHGVNRQVGIVKSFERPLEFPGKVHLVARVAGSARLVEANGDWKAGRDPDQVFAPRKLREVIGKGNEGSHGAGHAVHHEKRAFTQFKLLHHRLGLALGIERGCALHGRRGRRGAARTRGKARIELFQGGPKVHRLSRSRCGLRRRRRCQLSRNARSAAFQYLQESLGIAGKVLKHVKVLAEEEYGCAVVRPEFFEEADHFRARPRLVFKTRVDAIEQNHCDAGRRALKTV